MLSGGWMRSLAPEMNSHMQTEREAELNLNLDPIPVEMPLDSA